MHEEFNNIGVKDADKPYRAYKHDTTAYILIAEIDGITSTLTELLEYLTRGEPGAHGTSCNSIEGPFKVRGFEVWVIKEAAYAPYLFSLIEISERPLAAVPQDLVVCLVVLVGFGGMGVARA